MPLFLRCYQPVSPRITDLRDLSITQLRLYSRYFRNSPYSLHLNHSAPCLYSLSPAFHLSSIISRISFHIPLCETTFAILSIITDIIPRFLSLSFGSIRSHHHSSHFSSVYYIFALGSSYILRNIPNPRMNSSIFSAPPLFSKITILSLRHLSITIKCSSLSHPQHFGQWSSVPLLLIAFQHSQIVFSSLHHLC